MERLFRQLAEEAIFWQITLPRIRKATIMKYILTGNEMAEADRLTSEKIGIPSIVLMERAALSVADEIAQRYPARRRVTILAGPGNNGADGLAAGRILSDRGYEVQFLLLTGKEPPEGSSAKIQQTILRSCGLNMSEFAKEKLEAFSPGVIVDALFGTGLQRPLAGRAAQMAALTAQYCARTGCKVVGLDIPSGISSEDGSIMGCAFECDLTVTFAYYKRGHLMYPGCRFCGETVLREIGIHDRCFAFAREGRPEMFMYEPGDAAELVGGRDPGGNKGTFGKILIAAGSFSMCGAALLCAKACMRSGAGMVKIFTREENRTIIQQALPEAMLTTYEALPGVGTEEYTAARKALADSLIRDLEWADVVAAGPAIGLGREGECIVRTILEHAGEKNADAKGRRRAVSGIILDADALRLIASDSGLDLLLRERNPETACILTPHLAEFADLVHVSVSVAGERRIPLMRELASRYHCTVLGKDARTLIVTDGVRPICMIANGNSGMATAGSGDVLCGITGAMLAGQRNTEGSACRAAQTAALIHAMAGSRCKEKMGERAMLAGDILTAAGEVLKDIENT